MSLLLMVNAFDIHILISLWKFRIRLHYALRF